MPAATGESASFRETTVALARRQGPAKKNGLHDLRGWESTDRDDDVEASELSST